MWYGSHRETSIDRSLEKDDDGDDIEIVCKRDLSPTSVVFYKGNSNRVDIINTSRRDVAPESYLIFDDAKMHKVKEIDVYDEATSTASIRLYHSSELFDLYEDKVTRSGGTIVYDNPRHMKTTTVRDMKVSGQGMYLYICLISHGYYFNVY